VLKVRDERILAIDLSAGRVGKEMGLA